MAFESNNPADALFIAFLQRKEKNAWHFTKQLQPVEL